MSKVRQFYDRSAEYEWNRLERHRMEYAVTMRALADYLPPAPAAILDIGGGPGRYAIALAKQGYRPTLFDLTPGLLAFARTKAEEEGVALADIICGNALALPFPDATFDAVLLMGPLYHLLAEADRRRAVQEAFRVLKPGGVCVASFICRYAPFRDAATRFTDWVAAKPAEVDDFFRTGRLVAGPESVFTDAYFIHPNDVRPLMEGNGFDSIDLMGVEALVDHIEEQVNQLTGDAWDAWVEINYRAGKDPCLHGGSSHLLWVGRRPDLRLQ
ncbi:MAG TPA: methyltransferase domain-containing protein [Symbiobacteriaceae bacterium]|jgi:S-adenosylmethionine-dependent methyltransferase|nr:methyltransferase domain-containing protein [Symbiobacteriaceae bacterium]